MAGGFDGGDPGGDGGDGGSSAAIAGGLPAAGTLTVNWGGSSLTSSTSQKVYLRRLWSDPWTLYTRIWAVDRSWTLLPAPATATLILDYGKVLPHAGQAWVTQPKLNIGGWYVKIVDTCADGTLTWCGFIDEIADDQGGQVGTGASGIPTGRQTFVAYSIAQILAHEFVTRSRWNDPENNVDRWSGSAGVFNADGRGNMSAAQTSITDDNVFDYGHLNRDFGTFWSSRDIVRYLFSYAKPVDKDDNEKLKFSIKNLELIPDWDKPTIETEGKSVLSLLNEIVNPSRMLQLSTTLDESTTPDTIVFKVHSLASADLSLPNSETHSKNADEVQLITLGAHDTHVTTQGSVTSKVNQVVVKGDKRETTGTFKIIEKGSTTQILQEMFTSTIVTAYQTAASGGGSYSSLTDAEKRRANELVRTKKTIEDAYRVFTINDKHNMATIGGSGGYVFEEDDLTGSGTHRYFAWWANVKFMPKLPFKRGVDYSGSKIADDSHDDDKKPEDYRSPLVLFKRDSVTKYLQAEKMHNRDNDPSFSVAVGLEYDAACFTLDVQGAEQHAIAHTRFTALPVDKTTTELGKWNYKDAQITFSIQEDRYAEGRYPKDGELVAGTDMIRRKVIYAGQSYKLIKVLHDTITDIDTDGAIEKTSSTAYIRDDRKKLESLAKLAGSWWLVTRKVLRLVSARPSATPFVGQLLSVINPGSAHADIVNTIVSEIRLSTPLGENGPAQPATYSLTTAMGELDPLAFSPPPPGQPLAFQQIQAGPVI